MNFISRLIQPSLLRLGALVTASTLAGGCAKSPTNGPTIPNAPNRLTVTLNTQQPLNPRYLYAFAFDDDDENTDGPRAIVSSAPLSNNGIVGGSFSVLVLYQANSFVVYRRTLLGDGSERLDRASRGFITPPSPASGTTVSFTLNLDAKTDNGTFLFRHDANDRLSVQRLDTNFVTTSIVRRDPNDNRPKPFDAFGNRLANFYYTFDIRGTRTGASAYQNRDLPQPEPTNDVQPGFDNTNTNLAQLDITDFSIAIQRTNTQ